VVRWENGKDTNRYRRDYKREKWGIRVKPSSNMSKTARMPSLPSSNSGNRGEGREGGRERKDE
jgi:hypothetical protein